MTEPLTQNRVDIKAILADPLLREELLEGATDFICKVEGIRRKGDLKMTELSPQAQAVLDAAFSAYWSAEQEAPNDAHVIAAAALRAAADQVVPEEDSYEGGFSDSFEHQCRASERRLARAELLAIAAELEGSND
jgi:hypothetical protein